MRLQEKLGNDYTIIEEGFNGRTTVHDDPTEGGFKSGIAYLPPCLMSHNPLDIVILMLGTNDTKQRFGMNAFTIAQCISELVRVIMHYGSDNTMRTPQILIASPILVGDGLMGTPMGQIFGQESVAISKNLAWEYMQVARQMRCAFINAADYASPCKEDCIHMTAGEHEKLAQAFYTKIKTML